MRVVDEAAVKGWRRDADVELRPWRLFFGELGGRVLACGAELGGRLVGYVEGGCGVRDEVADVFVEEGFEQSGGRLM